MKCIFALNPHRSITGARRAPRPVPMKSWLLPFAKVLRWRKLRKGVWGVLLCIWQHCYIVINIASRCFEGNSLCFILRFLAGFILRLRTLRRVGPSRQMHLPWWNTFAIPLQQWPRDYSQFTLDFKKIFFYPVLKMDHVWGTNSHSYHTHSFCPESEENEWVNQLTYFHPISGVECVHFLTNGMSFCRSLWSRINPGIKTDFLRSNLPSSIDFFTLTESVLPNLTWQWFCTMAWEHLGSSLKELLLSFLSAKWKGKNHPS